MPLAPSQDARIYYEEVGSGTPLLFIHEFGGDHRSWDDQVRHFSRGWRCIAWSARGYAPSDCPTDEALYGQDFFNRDAIAVLDAARVERAHIVGLSMGGYTALMLAAKHPDRVISCTAAGAGSGALNSTRAQFIEESRKAAAELQRVGKIDAEGMWLGPARVQLSLKDPIGWRRAVSNRGEHSAAAAALTLRTVQAGRASLYDLEAELTSIRAPLLLLAGDEDEPCLDVNLWLKRLLPVARLGLLPGSGHCINLEEPALFNALIERFIVEVERGSWRPRDARAMPASTVSSLSSPRSR